MQFIYDLIWSSCRTLKHSVAFFGLVATVLLSSQLSRAQVYTMPDFVQIQLEKDEAGKPKDLKLASTIDRAFLAAYQVHVRRKSLNFDREATLAKLAQDLALRESQIAAAEAIYQTEKGRILWTLDSWRALQLEVGFRLEDFNRFSAYTAMTSLVDIERLEGLSVSVEAFKRATAQMYPVVQEMFRAQSFRFDSRWELLASFMNLPLSEAAEKSYAKLWAADLARIVNLESFEKRNLLQETDKFLNSFSEKRQLSILLLSIEELFYSDGFAVPKTESWKAYNQLVASLSQRMVRLLKADGAFADEVILTFEKISKNSSKDFFTGLKPTIEILKPILKVRGELHRLENILESSLGTFITGGTLTKLNEKKSFINLAHDMIERLNAYFSLNENLSAVSRIASERIMRTFTSRLAMPAQIQARDLILVELLNRVQDADLPAILLKFADTDTPATTTTEAFKSALLNRVLNEKEAIAPILEPLLVAFKHSLGNSDRVDKIFFLLQMRSLYEEHAAHNEKSSVLLAEYNQTIFERGRHLLVRASDMHSDENEAQALKLIDSLAAFLKREKFNELLKDVLVETEKVEEVNFRALAPLSGKTAKEQKIQVRESLAKASVYQKALRYLNAQKVDAEVVNERTLPNSCSALLQKPLQN